MSRTYNVIDSDGHVLEPVDLWQRYIDPAYREQAPKYFIDERGKEMMWFIGRAFPGFDGIGSAGAIDVARGGDDSVKNMKYADGRKGGFDPHARIADLDFDGIDAVFLYPTMGLWMGAIEDPKLAAAAYRAYNRWLADFCKPYPQRLFGVAMLPMQSVELAIEEMRFARQELGVRSGFVRPNRYNNRQLDDRAYDPLWAQAQELDFAIGIHEGLGGNPAIGADRFANRGAKHIVSHTMEMMLASLCVIWGGVCERFPKLRFGFLEAGGGWMPAWLDRMDRHVDDVGFNDTKLKTRPSDAFRRQCFISFEPTETSLKLLAEHIGPDHILWATDYPHPDGFIDAPGMIRKMGLRPDILAAIMCEGAKKFYGLNEEVRGGVRSERQK